ncbi:MAG: hypothetical protein CLLPBCKN_000448 [Chroococcidiopsis cubana SAG 39.79]|uniref:Cryptochrome/DNA photolyase FAD-binding domain-containing protein n=1 Tax=Chroococcidiopsis cubana SAG 39.79 TaxID=388085 RepID=A0AB37UA45_9CYAN|nr:hypothetical protein [Chroococcidiopsis cubana]MDZ4871060.1 hypothetical protein [Chroococcidiopsis cubana SAG 39.79]PSB65575.1 hypothetical protein C7B79_04750 [Chroococcidiopsis cubana CCALA 043]RUT02347.1 hypothetical protein DSM107010_62870 [Chroococcidiopsis cubana SAG 39.79]
MYRDFWLLGELLLSKEDFWTEDELIPWSADDFYEPWGNVPLPKPIPRLFDKITDHVADTEPERTLARYKRLGHRRAYLE